MLAIHQGGGHDERAPENGGVQGKSPRILQATERKSGTATGPTGTLTTSLDNQYYFPNKVLHGYHSLSADLLIFKSGKSVLSAVTGSELSILLTI